MRVLITRKIPGIACEILDKAGIEYEVYGKDNPIPVNTLIRKGNQCGGIISLLTDKFDRDTIDKLPKLKIIANYAVGYNNIDVDYAKKKGIVVTNTPDILTDATADLTLALILAVARRIVKADEFTRDGKYKGWKPGLLLGVELRNKTVGIVGAGSIGSAVALRMINFGVKIQYCDKYRNNKLEKECKAEKVSLNKLLRSSDIVSVHLPLTDATTALLNKERLSLLKEKAILVNTSRGEIIAEPALIELLEKKKIFGAGLDVFVDEPYIDKRLFKLENAVLAPHIGSATTEARGEMARLAAENVAAVLQGKKAITPV